MKFTLLLCFSLLFSLFHAVAMPISNIGDSPVQAEAPMMKHSGAHCDDMLQDDVKMQNCCSGAALQTVLSFQLMSQEHQNVYDSLSPRLLRQAPDALFRPPKFHPALVE